MELAAVCVTAKYLWRTLFGTLLLGFFCFTADSFATSTPFISNDYALRAKADNAIHGLVGMFSWAVVVGVRSKYDVIQILLCGILASGIDIDHFILARSLVLKDALTLPHRPPFHAILLTPLVAFLLALFVHYQQWNGAHVLPYIFLVAWLSHLVRDSTKRGLWFWPFGATPNFPYWAYINLVMLLPLLAIMALRFFHGYGIRRPLEAQVETV